MQAFMPSLFDALGLFIPLIVVNCLILGRAEAFASKQNVLNSILDGLGMGLGFAMAVDPQNGVQVPVLSQLYVIFATLIFLSIDGHLILIQFLADSFILLPVSLTGWSNDFGINVVLLGSQMFLGALLLVLPALTAILLINVAFGVITRAAPQLNIFAVGFPVTILAGFVFITLSMPSVFERLVNMFDTGLSQALIVLK